MNLAIIRAAAAGLAGPAALLLIGKLTLVLAAAELAVFLLRRRAAATRAFVWLVALAGALALAAFTPVAPRLSVPVRAPQPLAAWSVEQPSGDPLEVGAAAHPASAAAPSTAPNAERAAIAARERSTHGKPSPARGWPPADWLAALWIAGAFIVLLWSGLAHAWLARLVREASPVDAGPWAALLADAREASRVETGVRLGVSPAVGSPLLWGLRPVILLPRESHLWPRERRLNALLHELAHVARGDFAAQALATLACALYWFHPLVWRAARKLRSECEHACDDRVLASGAEAPEYASSLLEVARGARALRGAGLAAVGMARRSTLEGRLLAVLDPGRSRGTMSRGTAWVAAALAGAALVALAGLEPRLASAGTARSGLLASGGVASTELERHATVTTVKTAKAHREAEQREPRDADEHDSTSPTFARELDASPGGTLELDLQTGGEVSVEGWDRPSVAVSAHLGGRDWEDTRVSTERTGRGVRLHAWQATPEGESYSTSHKFEIHVPARYDVRLRSAGGGLTLIGVEGSFRGHTGGGAITIEDARGSAFLTTGGGPVEVTDSELEGSVTTGGGSVIVERVKGGFSASSGSGTVRYGDGGGTGESRGGDSDSDEDVEGESSAKAPTRGPSGFIHFTKSGGAIELDEAPRGANVTTGGGHIRIGRSRGNVYASTGGGAIDLGPVAGSVRAGTGAGSVTVKVEDAGGGRQVVDIWSGTGNMTVDLPPDLDARFELQAAYTKSFGRPARIECDWDLERSETDRWDDREGTPRRYVRAGGVVGAGRGLVRIHTVNGDIRVRRTDR